MLIAAMLEKIDKLNRNFLDPDHAENYQNKLKAVISGVLGRLELVSEEEFSVYARMLEKSRLRIEVLEERIEILEKAQITK